MRLLLAFTLVLALLKALGQLDASWLLVLAPLWVPPAALAAIIAAYLLLLVLTAVLEGVAGAAEIRKATRRYRR